MYICIYILVPCKVDNQFTTISQHNSEYYFSDIYSLWIESCKIAESYVTVLMSKEENYAFVGRVL